MMSWKAVAVGTTVAVVTGFLAVQTTQAARGQGGGRNLKQSGCGQSASGCGSELQSSCGQTGGGRSAQSGCGQNVTDGGSCGLQQSGCGQSGQGYGQRMDNSSCGQSGRCRSMMRGGRGQGRGNGSGRGCGRGQNSYQVMGCESGRSRGNSGCDGNSRSGCGDR
jgi:hypothetical protein